MNKLFLEIIKQLHCIEGEKEGEKEMEEMVNKRRNKTILLTANIPLFFEIYI